MVEEEKKIVNEPAPMVKEEPKKEEIPSKEEAKPTNGKKPKKEKSKRRKIIEWVLTGVLASIFIFIGVYQIDGMIHRGENYGQSVSFGTATFVIKTDSMEPEYQVNTAIITHKDNADDIYKFYTSELAKKEADPEYVVKLDITFMDVQRYYVSPTDSVTHNEPTSPTGVPMTHRVFEIQVDESKEVGQGKYLFFVAGINISEHQSQMGQYQNFTEKELLGVVKVNSAFLGGILSFISTPWGLLILLLIPAFYLVTTSVLDIFKAMNEKEEATQGVKNTDKNGKVTTSSSNPQKPLEGLSEKDIARLKEDLLKEMMNKKGK